MTVRPLLLPASLAILLVGVRAEAGRSPLRFNASRMKAAIQAAGLPSDYTQRALNALSELVEMKRWGGLRSTRVHGRRDIAATQGWADGAHFTTIRYGRTVGLIRWRLRGTELHLPRAVEIYPLEPGRLAIAAWQQGDGPQEWRLVRSSEGTEYTEQRITNGSEYKVNQLDHLRLEGIPIDQALERAGLTLEAAE